MGFWDDLGDFFQPVVEFAAEVLTVVGLGALAVCEAIAESITTCADEYGLWEETDSVEALGQKALQEGTRMKLPEESAEDYLNYLRNDVAVDTNVTLTDEDKIRNCLCGSYLLAKNIEEKKHIEISPEFMNTIAKAKIEPGQLSKLVDSFSKNNIASMDIMTSYLKNDLPVEQVEKVDSMVESAIKEQNSKLTDVEIQREIVEMKRNYNS